MGDLQAALGGQVFNTDGEGIGDYSPVPGGWYTCEVDRAELKNTKRGDGEILKVTYIILDGEYKDRLIFQNINVVNHNQKAQEIGRRELTSLGKACGLTSISDTGELLKKVIKVKVKIQKDNEYGDSNRVIAFSDVSGRVAESGRVERGRSAGNQGDGPKRPWNERRVPAGENPDDIPF